MGVYQFMVKWMEAVTYTGAVDIEAKTYAEAKQEVNKLLADGYLPDVETDFCEPLHEPQACLLGAMGYPNVYIWNEAEKALRVMSTHEFLMLYADSVKPETDDDEICLNRVIFTVREQLHVTKNAREMAWFLAERIRNKAWNGIDIREELVVLQQLVSA